MMSQLKTILLLGLLSLVVIAIGGMLGGQSGLYLALAFSLVMNGVSYFFSEKIALSASGAQPLDRAQAPQIYAMVERLTQQANIPMPKLYITPDAQANAFATGRDPHHASVAVTQGLLQSLSNQEIEAVIAHELAHVKHRDILIASVAAVLASSIGFLANMGLYGGFSNSDDEGGGNPLFALGAAILAPIFGMIIQMAVSRQREYVADERAASLIGHGHSLASALATIHRTTQMAPSHVNPAFSSLYIGDPFGGLAGIGQLFSTHPPVEARIRRLQNWRP
jgi:heat shock protein HtpX